jgi:hypothetical protein
MVKSVGVLLLARLASILAQADAPAQKSLDSTAKFKLIAMLILLTIGGIALVSLSWLYLRVGRRVLKRTDLSAQRRRSAEKFAEDWARKPLHTRQLPQKEGASERDEDEPTA